MSDKEIRFDGRVAIVTGAGGGIGRAHALMLAARGCKVIVNDLGGNMDGTGAGTSMADKVVEEIKSAGGEAAANYNSVDSWDEAERIVKSALDNFGGVDIVINNAGILRDKSLKKMTDEEYRRVIEVHLNGSFYVTRAAFGPMVEKGYGRFLFTTSAAGLWGNFGQTNYSAAKLGIVGLMNTVKQEGMKYNIKANTVAPIAASRLLGTVMSPKMLENLDPNYVAAMAAYLVSEGVKVNGGIFSAGGGHYAFAQMIESAGINIEPGVTVSAELIRDRLGEIMDMKDAKNYFSAMENTQKALKAAAGAAS